jgi:serine acetyltransferase
MQANALLTGADIHPAANLGGGLLIPGPCGVNISGKAGQNLTALPLAGIGGSLRDDDVGAGPGLPCVGRDVTVSCFAAIQGSITVGDGAVIGPGVGAVAVNIAAGQRIWLRSPPVEGQRPPPARSVQRVTRPCGHAKWRRTRAEIGRDVSRYIAEMARYGPENHKPPRLSALLTNPLLALSAYRISHWLHLNGWPRLAMRLCQLNILLHKITIPPSACLAGGVLVPHLGGLVFSGRAGARLTLFANTLCTCRGNALNATPDNSPLLGNEVHLSGHAGVFGPVIVGDRAQLGPKAQLVEDLAAGWQGFGRATRGRPTVSDGCRKLPEPPERPPPDDNLWRETWRRLRQDRARLGGAPRFPAMTCVALYRLSRALHATGWRRCARWAWLCNIYLTGADISPCCDIGGGLLIPHPAGVALHCQAGDNLTIGATASIMAPLDRRDCPSSLDCSPLLGDNVELDHHAVIFGAVRVGNGVLLQPGCVVTQPVPDGIALSPPKLFLRRRGDIAASASDADGDRPIVGTAEIPHV